MKLVIELSKLQATTDKENRIKWYDVGFNIEQPNGTMMYAPTTVTFKSDMTEIDVIKIAAREVLPGQIAIAYSILQSEIEDDEHVSS